MWFFNTGKTTINIAKAHCWVKNNTSIAWKSSPSNALAVTTIFTKIKDLENKNHPRNGSNKPDNLESPHVPNFSGSSKQVDIKVRDKAEVKALTDGIGSQVMTETGTIAVVQDIDPNQLKKQHCRWKQKLQSPGSYFLKIIPGVAVKCVPYNYSHGQVPNTCLKCGQARKTGSCFRYVVFNSTLLEMCHQGMHRETEWKQQRQYHVETEEKKKGNHRKVVGKFRAGHFRYFWHFSIIKNDFLNFL